MAAECQFGLRLECEIPGEAGGQVTQDSLLTLDQPAFWIFLRGPGSWEVDTVQGQPGLEFGDLWGRRSRRKCFHHHTGG